MWSYVAAWRHGDMDIPGFVRECARLRVDGVELLDFFWKDRETETAGVVKALKETGLPVGVYSVSNNFVQPDAQARREQVEIIKRGVDSANEFGAKTVRVFAGDTKPGVTFEEALGWIIDGLTESATYAADQGVTLALENHGKLAGRSGQVITILDAVRNPALKANPDTGNFLLVHQSPHKAVAELAKHAGMVHFKDFQNVADNYSGFAYSAIDGLKFSGTAIGEGEVDLYDCLRYLNRAGFNGWLNIEYEAEEDPITGVARSVEYTRQLMENL